VNPGILELVLILLATAGLVVVIFRVLKLPALLGYLLVGIIIGPHASGLVPDSGDTRYLAEFGVPDVQHWARRRRRVRRCGPSRGADRRGLARW
jgi:hypothetical protein